VSTTIAFVLICQGKVQQHRVWVTRRFAAALGFVELRVIAGITGWETSVPPGDYCLVVPRIFGSPGDIVLQVQESRRARPIVSRGKVATAAHSAVTR
jgi:hypothetical protein